MQGSPGWAEHILFEFLHKQPRKIMFLGAGFSSCSTVVAALAGLDQWAIPQVYRGENYIVNEIAPLFTKGDRQLENISDDMISMKHFYV